MPTVKTPEERGPLGAWAYESRLALNLSPEQVVAELGQYDAATIRKAEADGRKNMSVPLWRVLTKLYSRLARERGIVLAPLPMPGAPEAATTSTTDVATLVAAIERQTAVQERVALALEALATELRDGLASIDATQMAQGNAFADSLGLLAAALGARPSESDIETAARRVQPGPGSGTGRSRTGSDAR